MPSEGVKTVKKEEVGEDEADEKCLSSLIRKKPASGNNAGSAMAAARKVKKEEYDEDDDKPIRSSLSGSRTKPAKKEENVEDDDNKPISRRNSSAAAEKEKELKKRKIKKEEEGKKRAAATQGEVKKREKKMYDLPGQKRDQPEERDPLRIFYESLYKQIPTSEMAQIWMMESGLLPVVEARKVLEKKQMKGGKFASPAKPTSSTPRRVTKPATVGKLPRADSSGKKKGNDGKATATKRKIRGDDDSDDDFLVSRASKKPRAK
ncbi:PREDICTED: uncharacterized protein LOC104809499 [Tarenaya hassleriana]|uniref:uncharacterized protein LOC104809499 n=1 Tax=Tarenaya hassleriana TaxID=28532 RepID=UPI00053C4C6C|nr:PREDICTED: uncharacterized protein LOC104809499 [Tarenaya hassleriana]